MRRMELDHQVDVLLAARLAGIELAAHIAQGARENGLLPTKMRHERLLRGRTAEPPDS